MNRSVKVSLKFATAKKRAAILALLREYRAAVNFYLDFLWPESASFSQKLVNLIDGHSRLNAAYKQQACRQALSIVSSTKKAAWERRIKPGKPVFKGAAKLSSPSVALVQKGQKSFDLVIKLSALKKGRRLVIPLKGTKPLNKWLAFPGSTLLHSIRLSETGIVLVARIPDQEPKPGRTLGVDIGVNKLIADSDGNFYGQDFRSIRNKVRRRRSGSKGKKRARTERNHYLNRIVNNLPWSQISVLGVENLKGLKTGKKHSRNKHFRKAMAPWAYRRVLNRIGQKSQENRVRLVIVPSANTSRLCPACGGVSKKNRVGEKFVCVRCDYSADADFVGATNVLALTTAALGSLKSPRHLESKQLTAY